MVNRIILEMEKCKIHEKYIEYILKLIQHPIHFDSCYFTLSTSNNRATPSFIDVLRSNNLRE